MASKLNKNSTAWKASAPFRAAVKGWAFVDVKRYPAIIERARPLACSEHEHEVLRAMEHYTKEAGL